VLETVAMAAKGTGWTAPKRPLKVGFCDEVGPNPNARIARPRRALKDPV
jgi:hypothetical protein